MLDSADDSLVIGKIDRTLPCDLLSDGSPFNSVLSLALDGFGGATENIELALGSSKLAHLGGRGEGVEDDCSGDMHLGVKGYKLIPVRSDSNSGILWFGGYHIRNVVKYEHKSLIIRCLTN